MMREHGRRRQRRGSTQARRRRRKATRATRRRSHRRRARARADRRADRRAGAGAGDHAVRLRARPRHGGRLDDRRDRAAARRSVVVVAHQRGQLALLSTATLLVGAVFVIPVGMLVDRVHRLPLLSASILLWSAASSRARFRRLQHAAAHAPRTWRRDRDRGPGDRFADRRLLPGKERGRVYSYILAEVAGTAAGFIVSGTVSSLISCAPHSSCSRFQRLPCTRPLSHGSEPLRGGQSYLEPGVQDLHEAMAAMRHRAAAPVSPEMRRRASKSPPTSGPPSRRQRRPATRAAGDPDRMPISRAIRYVLQIRAT